MSRGSGSMSIGPSASRSAPIATSTATCAARRSTRRVISPRSKPRSAHRAALAPRRTVRSVFFGGGTPSLMRPETVQGVIDAIAAAWRLDKDAEITLEANPTSVEAERFRGYRSAGVNRLSIGVQALNDFDLKALGRQAHRRRGAGRREARRVAVPALHVRPDLWPAGAERGRLAARAGRGSELCRRPYLALPTDDRAGHHVRAPSRCGQARAAGRRSESRAVPSHARIDLCARFASL